MHTRRPRWLIVTDLDGTLLDDDYDLAAAAAAIDAQTRRGRAVALASSKTLDELRALAGLCRRPPVLIFENGAGLAWPGARAGPVPAYRVELAGAGYPALRARLRSLRRRTGYHFLGFGDLSAREVAARTGLSEDGARLARHRAASEPVVWLDSQAGLRSFGEELAAAGYRLVQGGRFHHVMPRTDKADGLRRVAGRLAGETRSAVRVTACGDAHNDLAMLRAADRALVFPQRGGGHLAVLDAAGRDVGVRVRAAGPASWSRAVDRVLELPDRMPEAPGRLRRLTRSLVHE